MLATRYSEEELRNLGNLSALTTEQFVEILNKKGRSGPNGNGRQKVISAGEVRSMVENGREYVAQLPDGSVVVRISGA